MVVYRREMTAVGRIETWRGARVRDPRWSTDTCALAVGVITTLVAAGSYSLGAGRAYGLDASVTVHRFVATPSLLDPFRKQDVYNNHVLFSFADHLVYTLTGSTDEWVLRIVPILASALAVGVVATAVARRLGNIPALAAAAVVASSPALTSTGRDVRGYSMLLLACIVSTGLLFKMCASEQPQRRTVVGYVLALAAAIATHLYGLAMLPVHAAIVDSDRTSLRHWLPRWFAGGAIGLAAYGGVAATMLQVQQARYFRADFPLTLAKVLLGGTPVTVALLAVPLVVGAIAIRRRLWAVRAAALTAALVCAIWLVAPTDLYPRFFVWLLPAIAYVVALAIKRYRPLIVLIAAVVAVEALHAGAAYTRSDLPNRTASKIAEAVKRAGGTPCALGGLAAAAMEAYDTAVRTVNLTPRLPTCSVLLVVFLPVPVDTFTLPSTWRSAFPYREVLSAEHPGIAYWRHPIVAHRRLS